MLTEGATSTSAISRCPAHRRGLATPARLPPAPAGDFRRAAPLSRHRLSGRQLDRRGHHHRTRETRWALPHPTAQENHLGLSPAPQVPTVALPVIGAPPKLPVYVTAQSYRERT